MMVPGLPATEEFKAFRRHPALPGAVAQFGAWLIQDYDGNTLLNMLLSDRGRVIVGLFVSYLDVLPVPGSTGRGATLGAVQKLCRSTGLCSAGRAASLLAAMRFGGYVVPADDPEDRRRRLLRPTPKLIARQTGNWSRQFEAMALIVPDTASVPDALKRPAFRTAFLQALGAQFLGGRRLLDHAPVLTPLVESNAGLLILMSLALPALEGRTRPGDPVPLSISALSRRFCISRAHVRKLLSGARLAGLLAANPDTEQVAILPPLLDAILSFYAAMFALFGHCAATAIREEWRWANGAIHPDRSSGTPNAAALRPDPGKWSGSDGMAADDGGSGPDGGVGHGNSLRPSADDHAA